MELGVMMIVYPEHCGNSPKKILLIEIYKAITEKDDDFILEHVAEDVMLDVVGVKKLLGKKEVLNSIKNLVDMDLSKIEVANVITHGNVAAVYGCYHFAKGNFEFCDVYVFGSFGKKAKIKEIKSFLINPDKHNVI
jgi:hypothetical protein